MITTSQEYFSNLDILQNVNYPSYALLPSAETTLKINIETRQIEAPEFLSVEKDHKSETVYFEVDRKAGYIDLADTACIVIYNNADPKVGTRYYAVPYYDVHTKYGKIIFPWVLDGNVSLVAGDVEFSVQFFKINERLVGGDVAEKYISYSLNTLPTKSKILYGIKESQIKEQDEYYLNATQFQTLTESIAELRQLQKMYWTILDDSFSDDYNDQSGVQDNLTEILEKNE